MERQRGATDSTDEAREAVGMACVDRHIFFITPLSSRPQVDRLRVHHVPSASHSHGQPGQLRRRGWAEPRPPQASSTAPCARRAPTLPRKAAAAVLRETESAGKWASMWCWWRSRAPFAPSAFKLPPPRTLPHARAATPMRFHQVLRASAPSHHASWWRAPASRTASRRVRCHRHQSGSSHCIHRISTDIPYQFESSD